MLQWKHPLKQLEFNHGLVHQGELELGSSSAVTCGDSKVSGFAILWMEKRLTVSFLVQCSSKSHKIHLVAAILKTNKRKWLTTWQTESRETIWPGGCSFKPDGPQRESAGGLKRSWVLQKETTADSRNTLSWGSFTREVFYRLAFTVPKPQAFGHCRRQDNGLVSPWSVPVQPLLYS